MHEVTNPERRSKTKQGLTPRRCFLARRGLRNERPSGPEWTVIGPNRGARRGLAASAQCMRRGSTCWRIQTRTDRLSTHSFNSLARDGSTAARPGGTSSKAQVLSHQLWESREGSQAGRAGTSLIRARQSMSTWASWQPEDFEGCSCLARAAFLKLGSRTMHRPVPLSPSPGPPSPPSSPIDDPPYRCGSGAVRLVRGEWRAAGVLAMVSVVD